VPDPSSSFQSKGDSQTLKNSGKDVSSKDQKVDIAGDAFRLRRKRSVTKINLLQWFELFLISPEVS